LILKPHAKSVHKVTKVVLIGPLPKKNATGVAIGFQSLVEGLFELGEEPIVIDLQIAGEPVSSGKFSIQRSFQLIYPLVLCFIYIPLGTTTYLTISCSRAGFFKDFLIVWWSKLLGKRIVLHLKSGGYADFYEKRSKLFRSLIRVTLNRASKIIALGESIKTQFGFVSKFDERVVVIPNGPPIEIASSITNQKSLQNQQDMHILYLSNLIPSKGFMDVLHACEILVNQHQTSNVVFHFCGAFQTSEEDWPSEVPSTADEFRDLVDQLGLKRHVIFHGTVRGEVKQKMFDSSHLFILPTQYPTEGQPISIIEAMANGLPVVATRWRGIVEQVVEGQTGFFVNYQDPAQIAEIIARFIKSPELVESLSKKTIDFYSANFTRKTHIQRMQKILYHEYRC